MKTIPEQSDHSGYLDIFTRRNRFTWLWSTLAAAGLNLALFLMMPYLMDRGPSEPTVGILLPQVNVLRFKRQEADKAPDTVKTPEPEKNELVDPPKTDAIRPLMKKPVLPFEINTRLPDGPGTLSLPAPEFDTDGLDSAFTVGELDSPLTVLVRIPPEYPVSAKHKGIEGWVRVRFLVNEDGTVSNVVVMAGDPPEIFDQSVIRCVTGWRFQAGTVEGVPVTTRAETTIWFDLEQ